MTQGIRRGLLGAVRGRGVVAGLLVLALVIPPGSALAGPSLFPRMGPAFTPRVNDRFTPCCGGRTWVKLEPGPGGRSLAWEVRWFARRGGTIGGERGALPLAPPADCEELSIHAFRGRNERPRQEVPARGVELVPGRRIEVVARQDVSRLEDGEEDRVAPSPPAPGLPAGPAAAEWTRRLRDRLGTEPGLRPECRARVRVTTDPTGRWHLAVTSRAGAEWAAVERRVPSDRHPAAYALYPLSVPADAALILVQVGVVAAFVTVVVAAYPFYVVHETLSRD